MKNDTDQKTRAPLSPNPLSPGRCSTITDASFERVWVNVGTYGMSVSPFGYCVSGKERKCSGATFKITPTKLKEMKMAIELQAPEGRDDVWVFMPNKLPVRNIVKFGMVDETGGKLEEGVDYRLNTKGAVSQLKGKQSGPISTRATFTYLPDRYDSPAGKIRFP